MKVNLAAPNKAVDEKLLTKINDFLKNGKYILGDETKAFEQEFASFSQTKFAATASSGTTALMLALQAMDLKGKEVITTPHTFIATANTIVHAGASPVFVDIDKENYCLDPEKIEDAITDKTAAIMPVHLYGHPADMGAIGDIAEDRNLKVIEDACQAHGAEFKGQRIGSIGTVAGFSFFPSKIMTVAGDGGMTTTNDEALDSKIKSLRNQGRLPGEKYSHAMIGHNFRMSEILALVGRDQLNKLDDWITSRREIASQYSKALDGVGDLVVPSEASWAKHVYYVYTLRSENRDAIIEKLKANDVGAGIYFPIPVHKQPAYGHFNGHSYPVTEKCANEVFSIPMHPYMSDDDIEAVIEAVTDAVE